MDNTNKENIDHNSKSSALDLLLSVRVRNTGEAMQCGDVVLLSGRFVRLGFCTDFDHYYVGNNVTSRMHDKVFCVDR